MAEQAQDEQQTKGSDSGSAFSRFAEDVAGALLSPGATLRSVGEREAIVPAIMLVFLIVAISAAGQTVALLLNVGQITDLDMPAMGLAAGPIVVAQLVGILMNFLWAPVLWTIVAAMLYGAGYLLGGRGRFSALWAASGFALAPQLLVAPLTTASEFLGVAGAGWQLLGWLFVLPLTIGAFFWTLGLFVIAIRETMSMTTGRAVGTVALFLGFLLMLAIFVAILIFLLLIAGLVVFSSA